MNKLVTTLLILFGCLLSESIVMGGRLKGSRRQQSLRKLKADDSESSYASSDYSESSSTKESPKESPAAGVSGDEKQGPHMITVSKSKRDKTMHMGDYEDTSPSDESPPPPPAPKGDVNNGPPPPPPAPKQQQQHQESNENRPPQPVNTSPDYASSQKSGSSAMKGERKRSREKGTGKYAAKKISRGSYDSSYDGGSVDEAASSISYTPEEESWEDVKLDSSPKTSAPKGKNGYSENVIFELNVYIFVLTMLFFFVCQNVHHLCHKLKWIGLLVIVTVNNL